MDTPRKQPSEQKSVKRKTVAGDEYQKIVQVLVRQRSHPGSSVGCEVSGVGSFDDIVYTKKEGTNAPLSRFFQIKHSEKNPNITTDELFRTDLVPDEKQDWELILLQCFAKFFTMKIEAVGMSSKHECLKTVYKFEETTFITIRDVDLSEGFLQNEKWEKGVFCWHEGDIEAAKYSLIKSKVFEEKQEFIEHLEKYKKTLPPEKYSVCSETWKEYFRNDKAIVNEFIESFRIISNYKGREYYKNKNVTTNLINNSKANNRYVQKNDSITTKTYVFSILNAPKTGIDVKELLQVPVQSGKPAINFILLSYFESYLKIKKNQNFPQISEMTIVTNQNLVKNKILKTIFIKEHLKDDECLYFKNINANKYKLKTDSKQVVNSKEKYIEKYKVSLKFEEEDMCEFLSKLRLVVGYPQLEDLRNITFDEVFRHRSNQREIVDILQASIIHQEVKCLELKAQFMECEEWRKAVNGIGTRMDSFRANAISEHTAKTLCDQVSSEYLLEDIELFKSIQQFMDQNRESRILNLLVKNVNFCSIIVLHTLRKHDYRYYSLESLVKLPWLHNLLKTNYGSPTIVICDEENSPKNLVVKKTAREKVGSLIDCNSKIILISSSNDFSFSDDHLSKKVILKEYSLELNNFNQDFKNKVLNFQITFQGKQIKLNNLLCKSTFASEVINENFLWEIVRRRNEAISIQQSVHIDSNLYEEDYFIQRSVFKRAVAISSIRDLLKQHLFIALYDHTCQNVDSLTKKLIKDGIDKNEIRQWFLKSSKKLIEQTNSYQEKKLTLDYGLILISINDYKVQARSTLKGHKKARFLLMFKGRDLYFIESYSITEPSDVHVLATKISCSKIDNNNGIRILAAESGLGKSTYLTSLAKKFKDSSVWVVRVELRKYYNESRKEKIYGWGDVSESENAIKVVLSMALGDDFKDVFYFRLLEQRIKYEITNFKLALLLDGYNEIDVEFQDITRNLISTLVKKCYCQQIWITTDLYTKEQLELDLNTPASFFCDLSYVDQVDLMTGYWIKQLKCRTQKYTEGELRQDAETSLRQITASINSPNTSLFSQGCLNVIILADYLISIGGKKDSIDLSSLYNELFMKRMTISSKKTSQLRGESMDVAKHKCLLIYMREIHEEVAVKHYLEYKDLKKLQLVKLDRFIKTHKTGLSEHSEEQSKYLISNMGVLRLKHDRFSFYDESFAQFFLSEFLLNNVRYNCNVQDILINIVLVKDNLKLCRQFLENSLKGNFLGKKKIGDPFMIETTGNLRKSEEIGQKCIEEKLLYTLILYLNMHTLEYVKIFVQNIKEKNNWITIDMNKDLPNTTDRRNRKRWENIAAKITDASKQ